MRVLFLMERGSPPRLNPVFAELFALLAGRGMRVGTLHPEEELLRLDAQALEADLYVLKSDTELSLSLATALEELGAPVLNRAAASALVRDKVLAASVLHRAGIPVPRSLVAARPAQLAQELERGPLVLKPHRGYHGAGIAVATTPGELPAVGAYPDLVFAQEHLARARTDLKVFAVGADVFGVRKAFGPDSFVRDGTPAPVPLDVEEIAHRCGEAFGLELFGLDVAEGEDGPRVLDVNYLPGYRGVPAAARRLADCIVEAAHGRRAEAVAGGWHRPPAALEGAHAAR